MTLKPQILAFLIFVMLNFFAFAIFYVGSILAQLGFGDFTILTSVIAYVLITISGFVLFWPATLEGNTWLARNVGGQNVALDMMLEPGSLFSLIQIKATDKDFKGKDDQFYKIDRDQMVVRRGAGIPYQGHILGQSDPLDFKKYEHGIDAAENTTYLLAKISQIKAKMFNEQFTWLFIIGIASIAVTIIVGLLLYLGVNDIKNAVNFLIQFAQHAATQIPTATPGAIPNA